MCLTRLDAKVDVFAVAPVGRRGRGEEAAKWMRGKRAARKKAEKAKKTIERRRR